MRAPKASTFWRLLMANILGAAAAGLVVGCHASAASPNASTDSGPNQLLEQECGACHMAYPPPLLPARSWRALMARLPAHFGENAEIDAEVAKSIGDYLAANAADAGDRSSPVMRSLDPNEVPLRITGTRFWQKSHLSIPERDFLQVKSKSNCLGRHNTLGGYTD